MGTPACGHPLRNPDTCHDCARYLLKCTQDELSEERDRLWWILGKLRPSELRRIGVEPSLPYDQAIDMAREEL